MFIKNAKYVQQMKIQSFGINRLFIFSNLKPSIKSALLAVVGSLLFSVSTSLAKQLSSEIPTTLVVFIRSCFGLMFFLPVLIFKRDFIIKTQNLPLHILRIIIAFFAILCTYYAYRNLPLAFATSIGMSSPLFTIILSFLILKEKIGLLKLLIVLIGYLGVLMIIKPSTFLLDLGILSSIFANILAASALIILKILSRYDSTITIMFYTNIGIVFVSCMFSLDQWQALNIMDCGVISVIGLLSVIVQFCSINAVKYSSPSFVAPFEFIRFFLANLVGIIIFDETLDFCIIIGGFIILSTVCVLTCLDIRDRTTEN